MKLSSVFWGCFTAASYSFQALGVQATNDLQQLRSSSGLQSQRHLAVCHSANIGTFSALNYQVDYFFNVAAGTKVTCTATCDSASNVRLYLYYPAGPNWPADSISIYNTGGCTGATVVLDSMLVQGPSQRFEVKGSRFVNLSVECNCENSGQPPTTASPTTVRPTTSSPITTSPMQPGPAPTTVQPTVAAPAPPAPAPAPICFSATSTVQVLGKGLVPMDALQVGDYVLTGATAGKPKYQSVYAFGHYSPTVPGSFLEITTTATASGGTLSPLEISSAHLIFMANKNNPVRADSLKVGDVLILPLDSDSSSGGQATVTFIRTVERTGLYAPLTADGNLIVNRVAVSTYVALQDGDSEYLQLLSENNKKGVNLLSHGQFAHLFLSPFRMICIGISPSLCQVNGSDGIPHYIALGMAFFNWTMETQSALVQLFLFALAMPILATLWITEGIFGPKVSLVVILALAMFVWKRKPFIQHSMLAKEKKMV